MKINLLKLFVIMLIIVIILPSEALIETQTLLINHVDEVLVHYDKVSDLEVAMRYGCVIERDFKLFNTSLMLCPSNVIENLRYSGLNVVKNFDVKIDTIFKEIKPFNPSTLQQNIGTAAPSLWSWAISRVSADIVFNYLGEDGSDVVIAILDTGIDPTHPLLVNKLVAWIEFDAKGRPLCSKPHDTHGHGTWVASIAVGGDGRNYIFGVAPQAKIMVALVLHYGRGTAAQVLAGLEWVLQPYDPCTNTKLSIKPNVVSMSFGAIGNYSNVFLPAIKKLIENGIVAVAAIGNSGPYITANPGNIWGVIGVGAVDYNNNVALFSSYEEVEWPNPPSEWPFKGRYPSRYTKPDVVAPGVDVPGAFPGELLAIASGTSASTPIVAGVAAIVSAKLKNKGFSGSSLVEKVYDIITSTATPLKDPGAGYGLVDAYIAIARAKEMNVRVINLNIYPSTSKPLSNLTIDIPGVRLGIDIDVYISGSRVFSGTLRSRYVVVPLPLSHGGGNTVVVISRDGLIYGKTLVQVIPGIFSEKICYWGKLCRVIVSGVGIGDTIGIYFETNLVKLYISNLRGSFNASFIIPVVEEGYYLITAIDFSRPSVVLQTQVYIQPTQMIKPIIINNTYIITKNQTFITVLNNTYTYTYTYTYLLPLYIRSKDYYVANTVDFLDIYVYNGSIGRIDVDKESLKIIAIDILNISKIKDNLYRVWIGIGSLSIDEVYVRLNITIMFKDIAIPYLVTIRVLREDPSKLAMAKIYQLNETVEGYVEALKDLKEEVSMLKNNITNLTNNLRELSGGVSYLSKDVKDRIEFLEQSLESLEQHVVGVISIVWIAVILGIGSIVLSIVLIFSKYIYRRQS